ncbi:MAG: ribonuclease HI family protein [Acidobacteriota bacterium]
MAHIDGAARGNPGPAGYGVVVEAEGGRPPVEIYGYLGTATNNVAEYAALLALLEHAVGRGPISLRVRSDSELLVRQMRGIYRVKDARLRVLHAAARSLAGRLREVAFEHVPRERNREADALANRAIDLEESTGPLPEALRSLPRAPAQPRLS